MLLIVELLDSTRIFQFQEEFSTEACNDLRTETRAVVNLDIRESKVHRGELEM